jgi:hypothetical protein
MIPLAAKDSERVLLSTPPPPFLLPPPLSPPCILDLDPISLCLLRFSRASTQKSGGEEFAVRVPGGRAGVRAAGDDDSD